HHRTINHQETHLSSREENRGEQQDSQDRLYNENLLHIRIEKGRKGGGLFRTLMFAFHFLDDATASNLVKYADPHEPAEIERRQGRTKTRRARAVHAVCSGQHRWSEEVVPEIPEIVTQDLRTGD